MLYIREFVFAFDVKIHYWKYIKTGSKYLKYLFLVMLLKTSNNPVFGQGIN